MKISAVIIARNEEKYLGRCLDSVFEQKIPFDEVIVVDNASTDSTSDIAAGYKIDKLLYEENRGILWARRKGGMEASCDLIANLDSDSILPKNWTHQVLDYYEEDPSMICLSGPHVFIGENILLKICRIGLYTVGKILHKYFNMPMVQGGNYIVKRDAYLAVDGHDPHVTQFYGEDTHIAKRLMDVGKIEFKWGLKMPVSSRRMDNKRMFKEGWRYICNFFSTHFTGKPITYKFKDYR